MEKLTSQIAIDLNELFLLFVYVKGGCFSNNRDVRDVFCILFCGLYTAEEAGECSGDPQVK